jgi:hypothetical protein
MSWVQTGQVKEKSVHVIQNDELTKSYGFD